MAQKKHINELTTEYSCIWYVYIWLYMIIHSYTYIYNTYYIHIHIYIHAHLGDSRCIYYCVCSIVTYIDIHNIDSFLDNQGTRMPFHNLGYNLGNSTTACCLPKEWNATAWLKQQFPEKILFDCSFGKIQNTGDNPINDRAIMKSSKVSIRPPVPW